MKIVVKNRSKFHLKNITNLFLLHFPLKDTFSSNKVLDMSWSENLHQRNIEVLRYLHQDRNLSQQINFEHGRQDTNKNSVPYLHEPA